MVTVSPRAALPAGHLHASWPALAALGYVVWRPVSNGDILYPCLALLALAGLLDLTMAPQRWAPRTVFGCWLFACVAVAWLAYGSLRGNPGVLHQTSTWLLGPIAWSLWAFAIRRETVRRILTTLFLASAGLSLVIVWYTAHAAGLAPIGPPELLLAGQNASIDLSDGTALRFYGLSSLAMTAPMAATGAILGPDDWLPPRWLMVAAAFLGAAAAFVGGRRAIAVVALLLPLAVLIGRRTLSTSRSRRGSVIAVVSTLVLVGWALSLDRFQQVRNSIADAVVTFLGLPGGGSDVIRREQAGQLIAGFQEHPLLGSGLGAVLPWGYLRSDERPWQFELQYFTDLFALGLVGCLLLAVAAWALASSLPRAGRAAPEARSTLTTVAVTALSILIVNGSNPYLQAVGHQWAVPLALGVAAAFGTVASAGDASATARPAPTDNRGRQR